MNDEKLARATALKKHIDSAKNKLECLRKMYSSKNELILMTNGSSHISDQAWFWDRTNDGSITTMRKSQILNLALTFVEEDLEKLEKEYEAL